MGQNLRNTFLALGPFEDYNTMHDAIVARESRIFDACLERSKDFAACLVADEEEGEAPAKPEEEKQEEPVDRLAAIRTQVEEKTEEKEKMEAWLTLAAAEEGKTSPLSKASFYSRVSIYRLLKHLSILVSVSESSRDASDLLKDVLTPAHLPVLVRMAALGTAQAQCLVQKIFQGLLRLNMSRAYLDRAVQQAAADDKDQTGRVPELLTKHTKKVDMGSAFWDFHFNQIFLAKRAQFRTSDQVAVGTPAVIEEIIRTFLVIQGKEGAEYAAEIRGKVEAALQQIDSLNDTEIGALFSLVPESHPPLISAGKRCRDEESGEHFICLGFARTDQEHAYERRLSMV